GTFHNQGPTSTPSTMMPRTTPPKSASLWRRKRRHDSSPQRRRGVWAAPPDNASTVADAGVEPAIEHVCNEVEEDHQAGEHEGDRHDHRRVVGEDRADE